MKLPAEATLEQVIFVITIANQRRPPEAALLAFMEYLLAIYVDGRLVRTSQIGDMAMEWGDRAVKFTEDIKPAIAIARDSSFQVFIEPRSRGNLFARPLETKPDCDHPCAGMLIYTIVSGENVTQKQLPQIADLFSLLGLSSPC